jgi:hypothetical protein
VEKLRNSSDSEVQFAEFDEKRVTKLAMKYKKLLRAVGKL